MSDLGRDTDWAVDGEGRIEGVISGDWRHYFGVWGGYPAAAAFRAACSMVEADFRPVMFTIQFISGAREGSVSGRVELLSKGSSVAFVAVRLEQERPVLAGLLTLARGHPDAPAFKRVRAPRPPTSFDQSQFNHSATDPLWKESLDGRVSVEDYEAWRPGGEPEQLEWLRLRNTTWTDDDRLGAAACLLVSEGTMFLAARRAFDTGRWIAPSLDFTARFHELTRGEDLYLVRSVADHAGHGCVSGSCEVWSAEGRLLLTGSQQMLFREWRPQG